MTISVKLLTYASGLDAGVVVWIAPEIREEHRQALDWLNQRTDPNVDFFGVVCSRCSRSTSLVRPFSLRPIAFPNQWAERHDRRRPERGKPSRARGEAYRTFFQDLIDELRERHKFTKRSRRPAAELVQFSPLVFPA